MSNPITTTTAVPVQGRAIPVLNGNAVAPLTQVWGGNGSSVSIDSATGLITPVAEGVTNITVDVTVLGSDGTTILSGQGTGVVTVTRTADVLVVSVDFTAVEVS